MIVIIMITIVQACIHPDPARRPTCAQLLQTPFLQKAAANMPASIVAAQVGLISLIIYLHALSDVVILLDVMLMV